MQIQNHDGVITADYHTQYSSFALYEGRVGTNFNPYQASSNFDRAPANSTLRMEQRLIAEQRKWLVNFQPGNISITVTIGNYKIDGHHCFSVNLGELNTSSMLCSYISFEED